MGENTGIFMVAKKNNKIKLKLNIRKNRLGTIILQYEKEPYFYITFFPNDSISKVKLKYIKKFIEGCKLSAKSKKGKKLTKAIDIATRTFLEENPDLDIETKRNIFNIKLFFLIYFCLYLVLILFLLFFLATMNIPVFSPKLFPLFYIMCSSLIIDIDQI